MTRLLKNMGIEIEEKLIKAKDVVSEDMKLAYAADTDTLMDDIVAEVSKKYRIHYQDADVINIKIDRRKNICTIENDIRSTVEELVGGKNVSNILFKYRTLDGMVTIEKRR